MLALVPTRQSYSLNDSLSSPIFAVVVAFQTLQKKFIYVFIILAK